MKNIYQPHKVQIDKIEEHSTNVKIFRLKGNFSKNKQGMVFTPGQFVLISQFGYGEAPFGIASSPYQNEYIEIVVSRVGTLTRALHKLKQGDELFIRGPYGNGFPMNFIVGKDMVMITGGCGIPPVAALIEYIIANRSNFGRIYLIYGTRTPSGFLMRHRIEGWRSKIKILLTVDKPDKHWNGYVGMVTDMVKEIEIDPLDAVASMCGPGPMMDALERVLRPLGISDRRIFVSMERKMQCGVGKCQHCVVGDKYVCQDGPVFYFDQIDKAWD